VGRRARGAPRRVYRPDHTIRLLHETDVLDGGEVLPGFAVAVAELFPSLP
jgi:hypothetical protein